MRIGIVGSEAAKFRPDTESLAKAAIRKLLSPGDIVISGACHLGGIDVWAIEIARSLGLETWEFPPRIRSWPGYKERNLRIVEHSDKVICITLRALPADYNGMRFPLCYHCGVDTHVKSGGCWTMHQARKRGKLGELIVI